MKNLVCLIACILYPCLVLQAQIQLLNDEFDETESTFNWLNINEVEGWNISQLESYNIDDSIPGSMFMKPFTVTWYGEFRGALLFKEISGDFVISTRITATGHDHSSVPSSNYSLAGIMIRSPLHYPNGGPTDWQAGQQNYVFMSIGQATGLGPNFEIKTTCNSSSVLEAPSINTQTSEIRMARIDQFIIVLARFPGGQWHVRGRFDRNDAFCGAPFPDTVQIGMVTYTDWPKVNAVGFDFHNTHTLHPDSIAGIDPASEVSFNPDLIGQYDYIRFDSVHLPGALNGLDLSDTVEVSDAQLLSFLGYDTQSHCPENYTIHSDISSTWTTAQGINITAENLILPNSTTTFRAEDQIVLQPGFEVAAWATFQAELGGCTE